MPHILDSFPYFVAGWLFCCGLYGLITSMHLVHSVVCLAVLQSSTYVLLLSIGYRSRGSGAHAHRRGRRSRGGRAAARDGG
jgi:multisubunit Na+/H+ antiporter MnhC subunit